MAKLTSMEAYRLSISHGKRGTSCVWWRLRTGLEKLLLCWWTVASLLFFGLCIAIIILLSLQLHSRSLTESVCVTKECINEASRIMAYLDDSVDPCHDFYRFACGKWLNTSLIEEQSNSISSFSITQDQIDHKLRMFLEEPNHPIESKTVINLKNMYNSCMNLTVINELGSKPLLKYLKQFGGWPVLEGDLWDENNFDFIKLISKIRNSGFESRFLFDIRVGPEFKRNTKNTIFLAQPVFACLTNKELIDSNTTKVKNYLDFMVDVALLLGSDEDTAQRELEKVIRLESLLANASISPGVYTYISIKDLETTTSMNWNQLLSAILSVDLKIDENETLIISKVKNVVAIGRIITTYLKSDKRVLVNYILWKIVFQSIKSLDKSFTELYDDFYLQTRQLKRNTKRWNVCIKMVGTYMRTGLTSLYVIKDKEKEKKKKLVNQMFETIRWTLNQKLAQIDWMDESTRFGAIHKTNSIKKFIAFNQQLINGHVVDQFYDQLDHLNNNSLYENILKLQKWSLDTKYSKLRTKSDRNDWINIITSPEVNAYYLGTINGIKIPVWIINGIFFGANRPNYLNYGSLGWIIGHELIHPFDRTGGNFDSKGNYRDWWDVDTKLLFHNKTECFVKQYQDNFPENIGEQSKLSENMADNGGIEIAYRSYLKFVENNGKELPLPGLTYTSNQLFWIRGAQIWCSKLSPKAHKYFLQTSVHSLSEQRVQISFSNSEDFSKVFDCSERDAMNPKHKCKVW